MFTNKYDTLILGAGLAGAHAAELLAKQGRRVGIVEAKPAVGGRGYVRSFAGTDRKLEYGGSWITPWHTRMRAACQRHSIDLVETAPIRKRLWHDGRVLRDDAPVGQPERSEYDRVLARLLADALRSQAGHSTDAEGRSFTSITLNDYFARHSIAGGAAAQLMAWWMVSGGGDPAVGTAASLVGSCAHGDGSPDSMMAALSHTLSPGTSTLAERMIAVSGAVLHLDFPVIRVRGSKGAFTVTARDGRELEAAAIIVALPLNVLGRIDFGDLLSATQARVAARGHAGRSVKLWLRLAGVAPGILATGGGAGIQWLFTAFPGESSTETLAVGFGVDDGLWDPNRRADVEVTVRRLLPDAHLMGWDWHDWCADPWARGTWGCPPGETVDGFANTTWHGCPGLSFATSDTAPDESGWFEGALSAAEVAVATVGSDA